MTDGTRRTKRRPPRRWPGGACLSVLLVSGVAAEPARPRVVVTVARMSATSSDIVIPGDVQARYQSNISFRVAGRISERLVEVGQHVTADQVLARLEPEQQRSNLRDAEAALASARAGAEQARLTFARQRALMNSRYTTQVAFDQAEQQARVTQAQVEAREAQLGSMREQLSYTDLRAGVAGTVTARNAEVGQVVRAGDAVFAIARDGDRDAVFNVYEGLLAKPPASKRIEVVLIADPGVRTHAMVREIAPTVDARTGAVRVRATLEDIPDRMALGATVLGRGNLDAARAVTLPWGALFRWRGTPAIWVVDPADATVSVRQVAVESFTDDGMILKSGVADGERVVTAGIQFLHPGQRVTVVEDTTP